MKERLDIVLTQRGFFPTREKAKAAIMAGIVTVEGQLVSKAGTAVPTEAEIEVKQGCPYVGRGGLKLEKALAFFDVDMTGVTAMDIGASTGGFTDCMLQKGARKVYSVDVGYGQLDWKLRTDSRVVNLEKTNIRYLDRELITEPLDFISIDVSFISLKLVFPVAAALMAETGQLICLVKPQFEAGREQVGKNGIVRDKAVHKQVIEQVVSYGRENGLYARSVTYSPVTGAKGNIEYLLLVSKNEQQAAAELAVLIEAVVEEAHGALHK